MSIPISSIIFDMKSVRYCRASGFPRSKRKFASSVPLSRSHSGCSSWSGVPLRTRSGSNQRTNFMPASCAALAIGLRPFGNRSRRTVQSPTFSHHSPPEPYQHASTHIASSPSSFARATARR